MPISHRTLALLTVLACSPFAGCAADGSEASTSADADAGSHADTAIDAAPDGGGRGADATPPDAGTPDTDTATPSPDAGDTGADAPGAFDGSGGATCAHGCVSGTCVDGACVCDAGFAGERCETCAAGHSGPDCAACGCANGVCLDGPEGTGACVCPAGFAGDACADETSPAIPFDADGPYGTGLLEVAEDLAFPTADGEWRLSERWTGHHSVTFLFRYGGSSYSKALWSDNVGKLLKRAPQSAVLVFGAFGDGWKQDVDEHRARVDEALAKLDPAARAAFEGRIVHVEGDAGALPFVSAQGTWMFAIDRFQRWRQVGSLYDFATNAQPLEFLAHEAIYYDFEAGLVQERDSLGATVVPLWSQEQHAGGWGGGYASVKTVELPPAAEMATYDSMAVHLVTSCPGHQQGKDAGCNEWDYIQDLRICDVALPDEPPATCAEAETVPCQCNKPDGTTVDAARTCTAEGVFGACACPCNTELVRWVTPYGREGQWLTDVSPLLALVKDGGPVTFRFGGANGYLLDLDLLLWNAGKGRRPVKAQYLWGNPDGEGFNEAYNDGKHPDVAFTVPEGATGAELYAVISGHGFGAVKENCAEFCNHQHKFTLNGDSWLEDHPEASKAYGCRDQIADGVVPNQFGSWIFGRGGWCPGLDVEPWVVDVTEALGAENTISYQGLFGGKDYVPTVTDPGGYFPEIKMASWLVFYEDMP